MIKYLLALLLFTSIVAHAQSDLKFDKRLLECEDKWVVLPKGKDSTYVFGFVYLDDSAGLTFNLEGILNYSENQYTVKKLENTKYRIGPSEVLVAIIPKVRFNEFQIAEMPRWLAFYKNGDLDARKYRWGITYNAWGEQTLALQYLKGLKWENYDEDFFNNPFVRQTDITKRGKFYIFSVDDFGTQFKEDIISYCNLKLFNLAESQYKTALVVCSNEQAKAEMAYIIAFQYFKLKNKEKFKYWQQEIGRWILKSDDLHKKVEIMQAEMAKL